jgi:hypothetical protein
MNSHLHTQVFCGIGCLQSVALETQVTLNLLAVREAGGFCCIAACFACHYRFHELVSFFFKPLKAGVYNFSKNLGTTSRS